MPETFHRGRLFAEHFLREGIAQTQAWKKHRLQNLLPDFETRAREIFAGIPIDGAPNEADTVARVIAPVMNLLGWENAYLREQTNVRDRPDMHLLAQPGAWREQDAKDAVAIQENKRWNLPLDRRDDSAAGKPAPTKSDSLFQESAPPSPPKKTYAAAPSTQMLRYLSNAAARDNSKTRWGVLTNGAQWRLYYQGARSRAEEFFELDLPAILGLEESAEREHWLRVFALLFGRESFSPTPDLGGRDLHLYAFDEGIFWEQKVTQNLSVVVFEEVFARIAGGFIANDPEKPAAIDSEYLAQARDAAMAVLYRLLFVFYAEDRGLLPVDRADYRVYGARQLRDDIAKAIERGDANKPPLSAKRAMYYSRFCELCRAIDEGDPSLSLPPYNGGLFDDRAHPILRRSKLVDSVFAPAVDALSRMPRGGKIEREWVNYYDLSVQHLGSIYERAIEHDLRQNEAGQFVLRPNRYARRSGGSYYTRDALVRLVLERAAGPLVEERRARFADAVEQAAGADSESARAQLQAVDSAAAIVNLKICDPAMGSGHFLVSLVDFLTDAALEAMAESESAGADCEYHSPLAAEIDTIRNRIIYAATRGKWHIDREKLDDRQIVRRIVMKRAIYGADKNPMAVELAKLSLWLHTFTAGAPLTFMDHHLRCGDSLFGEWAARARSDGLPGIEDAMQNARAAWKATAQVESLSDVEIGEVAQSRAAHETAREKTRSLESILTFAHAVDWGDAFDRIDKRAGATARKSQRREALKKLLAMATSPAVLLAGDNPAGLSEIETELLATARELAADGVLHWEAAFAGVWLAQAESDAGGGFDAVIGNPPWDRMKMQEVEWFAERKPEIAAATTADARKKRVAALRAAQDPLTQEYDFAARKINAARAVARKNGQYPLLSGGDINLYALFVERALRLIRPDGIIGLLTPSGIYGDKNKSRFFRQIAESGRVAALFDFENRDSPRTADSDDDESDDDDEENESGGKHFENVHSSFKFCVFACGGGGRVFDKTESAFYLHDARGVHDEKRIVRFSPQDFTLVNPNTGNAPTSRSQRDADLMFAVYRRIPILQKDGEAPIWPFIYSRLIDMTNDSRLFRRAARLETDGFYPVDGNYYKRGDELFLPLFEGKMAQAFDHRAAEIEIDPTRIKRPGRPRKATAAESQNPRWTAKPAHWIAKTARNAKMPRDAKLPCDHKTAAEAGVFPLRYVLGFKHVSAPTNRRGMIAALLPFCAFGNSLPILLPAIPRLRANEKGAPRPSAENAEKIKAAVADYALWAPLLAANLNAFALDFVCRQKMQGQNLNLYILAQLPILPPAAYERKFGKKTAAEIARDAVLRLTFVADDMRAFALDQNYDGAPFAWDDEERRHLRARLDALFFILYGIAARADVESILDSFPIVRRADEQEFGKYRTREMILAYMNALEAGDTESRVSV